MKQLKKETRLKPAPKETKINIRMTKKEKDRIEDIASYFNMNRSEYLRTVALEPDTVFLIDKSGAIAEVKKELKRWGNNLNQLVKGINQDRLEGRNIAIEAKTEELIIALTEKVEGYIENLERGTEGTILVQPQLNSQVDSLAFTYSL